MRIACLHTADSNVAVFEAAAEELGLPKGTLHHAVRTDLLAAAEQAGRLTATIEAQTATALHALSTTADAVILTCSTLGPVAETTAVGDAAVPILRADAALAERAVCADGRVVVLCTVETTLQPTRRLFTDAAQGSAADIEVRLVPGAWTLFKAGDEAGYFAAISTASDKAYAEGATTVALAQSSMTGAAALVKVGPMPLTCPGSALAAAVRAITAASQTR